jgi:hypothetical protein
LPVFRYIAAMPGRRPRRTVAEEMIAAHRECERAVGKCADLREELRDLALALESGFLEVFEDGSTVTVAFRGQGRPLVFVNPGLITPPARPA